MAEIIALGQRRPYAAAAARFRRLSQEERDTILERAKEKFFLGGLTFLEQAAFNDDAGVNEEDLWNTLSPAEQAAEIAAFEEWERQRQEREPQKRS